MLFHPGRILITPGALNLVGDVAHTYLSRHLEGDWGECGVYHTTVLTPEEERLGCLVTSDDQKLNKLGVDRKERILSSYVLSGNQKIWIITEHGHESTTILLPSEY